MADFFITPCDRENCNHLHPEIACECGTNSHNFGLCDDPPPSEHPAYMQHHNQNDWIATVHNPSRQQVVFKAVDNCVALRRPNGDLESRCDGFLKYNNNVLIFVELKDRDSSGWLSKGRSQLTITIEQFAANHNVHDYELHEAYVCNKQRPLAVTGILVEIQKFKDDTAAILGRVGMRLKVDRNIGL